ncbi:MULTISPECIES: MotA/TolQ/ExbB proton channel family protein [Acidiphilium]|jgi:biopolymer transport protein ExbB|uniref:Outer membrane transport energization protein ExbB n=1 Tax=Acidiphilium rubrum TaxID=526 RepID=A0A8G2FLE7_ACIRU|nr:MULTISPECIES: MotA/TolQ/ExbB proton channel family protein [Acidiphilium]MBW4036323.1 MotA/TolQ/ExbB proton channel family protein [Pseudomonadota bacterium]OYW03788.1 MAG: flagellar motor protein MotA [Acidiphilium sp. 37-64-53]OZB30385.1 MAG: flagellar motor protein MotA [Acidiphilium sp. 34-64-41]SIQ77837.1 outer membrane transport energization protein ExbB [Acidiphilium rubrum]HQT83531.1 MotA/TolQ/ExbB proton channel family protein [Acidiphilium rubrum]
MNEIVRLVLLTGGLLAVMPLLLLITLVVAFERLYLLKKTINAGSRIHAKLRQVGYGNVEGLRELAEANSKTLQGHLIVTALASRGETMDELDNHLEEEIMDSMPRINRGLWILDTSVTIAPLLGLFGTIIGMIQAFNVLSAHGGPAKVTGGIADALVSTGAGLLIAIIAVYFVNYFNALSRRIIQQLELIKVVLINRFHTRGLADGTVGAPSTMAESRAAAELARV